MTYPAIKNALRNRVEQGGQNVTLRNFEQNGTTVDGPKWEQTDDSPKTVKAYIDRTGQGLGLERDTRSADVKGRRNYHVKDSVTGINDGGGKGASEIDEGGDTWVVMQQDDRDDGTYRLICWRED